jgi:hypothetical protein
VKTTREALHDDSGTGRWSVRIKEEREKKGYQVFVDSQQTDTVGGFPRKIEMNIERSSVLIRLLGQGTLEST